MKTSTDLLTPLYMGIVALAAVALIMSLTPYGAGVSPDSTVYIGAAQNLLAGKGYSDLGLAVTHFPPLYPLFLAGADLLIANPMQAARCLNALIFGINIGLLAWAVYSSTGRSFLITTCVVGFFMTSAQLLELHSWAWSEPLFITFCLLCIMALRSYGARPSPRPLVLSGLMMGCAILTRYIGIALLPAALVLVILSTPAQPRWQRARRALLWVLASCGAAAIVFARNLLLVGSVTDRPYAFHPLNVSEYIARIAAGGLQLVAPIGLPAVTVWVPALALCITPLILLLSRRAGNRSWNWAQFVLPAACMGFCLEYVLFLYLSISFFDASTPLDARLLAPMLPPLIVGGFSLSWLASQTLETPPIWWSLAVFVALLTAVRIPATIRSAAALREEGLGYTSRRWLNSETVQFVDSLPEDARLYSNAPDAVGFLAQRRSEWIPSRVSPMTLEVNLRYSQSTAAMCEAVRSQHAYLVFFDFIRRWYLATKSELESSCHLPILQQLADGTVFATGQP